AILHIRGKEKGRGMKNHQEIPLFNPLFFYNRPMIGRSQCNTKKQKSNKEEHSQDFPLFSDKYRAAPT
uniref:hypothetical protein n=1 Tax=Dialister succinatiphilus TaxID=487173 RepID=UPI004038DA60